MRKLLRIIKKTFLGAKCDVCGKRSRTLEPIRIVESPKDYHGVSARACVPCVIDAEENGERGCEYNEDGQEDR